MAKEASPRTCLNCGKRSPDRFCSRCGQRNVPPRLPVWSHLADIVGEHLLLDSRMARTVGPFLLRPGMLTREYIQGRRQRYSSPIRLYLLMSVLLFLGLSVGRFVSDLALLRRIETSAPAVPGAETLIESTGLDEDTLAGMIGMGVDASDMRISKTLSYLLGDDHPLSLLMHAKLARLHELDWAEARLIGFDNWLNLLPTAMFLLLPFCAVLLKLCLLGTGHYYAEHLVFALHLHAFDYLVLLVLSFVWTPIALQIGAAVTVTHLFLAVRTAYGCGAGGTMLRGSAFLLGYAALLLAALGATFWVALMMV